MKIQIVKDKQGKPLASFESNVAVRNLNPSSKTATRLKKWKCPNTMLPT